MSNGINDITKALAAKYAGVDIAPKPKREIKEYTVGNEPAARPTSSAPLPPGTPKVWPMDRIMLGSNRSAPAPKRPMVMMSSFSDAELESMLATPCKRGWDFQVWLEVVGLPTDLHEKHDAPMYQYAARAFLDRKREAHSR